MWSKVFNKGAKIIQLKRQSFKQCWEDSTAHLESQLGKGPWQHMGENSKMEVPGSVYNPRTDANHYHHQSVTKLQLWFDINAVCFVV